MFTILLTVCTTSTCNISLLFNSCCHCWCASVIRIHSFECFIAEEMAVHLCMVPVSTHTQTYIQWGTVSAAEEGPKFRVPQQVVVPRGSAGEPGGPRRGRRRWDKEGAGGGVRRRRTTGTAFTHTHRMLQEWKGWFFFSLSCEKLGDLEHKSPTQKHLASISGYTN